MASSPARWLIAASFGVLAVTLAPGPARAQDVASITVTPSMGLVDGQTVTVEGTGFSPNATTFGSLTVGLCPADILTDVGQAPFRCGASGAFPVPVDDAGSFAARFQVFRSQATIEGSNTLTCAAAPADCVVLALEVIQTPTGFEAIVATAAVTFRPETKADCRKGRWRNFTDEQGRPFRNPGHCLRFVRGAGEPHDP